MAERSVRVNELIKREISGILHTYYKDETVHITVTSVNVAPDLRNARIYYSVIGDETAIRNARRFFDKNKGNIRRMVSQKVVLKYLPHLKFFYDDSGARGSRLIDLLDEISEEGEAPSN